MAIEINGTEGTNFSYFANEDFVVVLFYQRRRRLFNFVKVVKIQKFKLVALNQQMAILILILVKKHCHRCQVMNLLIKILSISDFYMPKSLNETFLV